MAGASGRPLGDGPAHELTLAAWEGTFALNATPAFLAAREALRAMLDQPPGPSATRGSLVLMSSVLAGHDGGAVRHPRLRGRQGGHDRAGQDDGRLLRRARHPGQRAGAVAGAHADERRAAADPASVAAAERRQPLTRGFLDAADVTEAAVYLCSDESRAVTGQVLAVDGGWTVT